MSKRVSISEKVEEASERAPERMTIREDVSEGADEEIRSLVEAVNFFGLGRARSNMLL